MNNTLLSLEKMPSYLFCRYVKSDEIYGSVSFEHGNDVIVFVIRGSVVNNGEKTEAGKYFILPDTGGDITLSCSDPELFIIGFNGSYEASKQNLSLSGSYYYRETVKSFNRLRELEDEATSSLIEKTALFYQILADVYNEKNCSAADSLARSVMAYIVENYCSDISLEELSERYFYSVNYIIRAFRHRYAVTPYRHITHMRIDRAKQLLVSTTRSCEQIASECGYHDFSTFYKVFRAEVKCSPASWRKSAAEARQDDYRNREHALQSDNFRTVNHFPTVSQSEKV